MAKKMNKEDYNNELLREVLDYNMYCGKGAELIPVLSKGNPISTVRYFQSYNGEAMCTTKTRVIKLVNEIRVAGKQEPLTYTAKDVI